jgi:HSP20 family protein
MADIQVKRPQTSEQNERAVQRSTGERGISSRGWDPFQFSLLPFDFFGRDRYPLLRSFQQEMDRSGSFDWSPAIEVAERDGQLRIHADLPGLKPEDVKVELTDDALVIQGERKYEHEENKGDVYRSERRYGQFYREIPLPQGAKAEQAKAQFRDGVLEVTIPVPEQKSNRRSIPIESGSKQQK